MNTDKIQYLSSQRSHAFADTWFDAASPQHFWQRFRYEVLYKGMTKSGLDPEQPYRCVDIGAGRGVFRHLIEQDTAWIVDCVDLDQKALDTSLGDRGDNFYYDVFDQHESMLNKYDGLFLLDVLEHVDDAAAFLDASLTHLKPGGFFVINVPTPGWLFGRYDQAVGHHKRYQLNELITELPSNGISISKVGYWGPGMIPVLLLRRLLEFFVKDKEKMIRSGFEPPHPWLGSIMLNYFRLDRWLLANPPTGIGAFVIGRTINRTPTYRSPIT